MKTEQERAAFEAWLGITPCGSAHDLAWEAWQARAALQSQDRADAERWRAIARRFDRGKLSSKVQFLQAIRINPRDAPYTLASIIDRARRVEGGGE